MLEYFICQYSIMAPTQTVFTPDRLSVKIPTAQFVQKLSDLIDTYQNYDVRLNGNPDVLYGLSKQIHKYIATIYKDKPQPIITINGGQNNG